MESIAILLFEKFRYVRYLRDKPIKILDVGCGNKSPSRTKKFFQKCVYYGIDKEFYNLSKEDIDKIDRFFKKDLDIDDLSDIEDGEFDYVIMSHILEHLKDPYKLVKEVTKKVKPGGYIYMNSKHKIF